jgi:hypothetical protein
MLHCKIKIQFIFVMTVIDPLNSTAEAAGTTLALHTLGALGKMLYDSKMMKSFPRSFAFPHLSPHAATVYAPGALGAPGPAVLPLAALRGYHEPARRRIPSFTAAFAS